MSRFSQMDYERALDALGKAIEREEDPEEKTRLRQLARELAKKKAVAFAEMLLDNSNPVTTKGTGGEQ